MDEADLAAALRERRIAGAGLDVFDVEPLPPDHSLLGLDNVLLTPHIGYVTQEAYHLLFRQVAESIEGYLDGQLPPRVLNPEAGARRKRRRASPETRTRTERAVDPRIGVW